MNAQNHSRWHVKRGRADPHCALCAKSGLPPTTKPPEGRIKRRIVLAEKDVTALLQLLERVERMTAFVRDALCVD